MDKFDQGGGGGGYGGCGGRSGDGAEHAVAYAQARTAPHAAGAWTPGMVADWLERQVGLPEYLAAFLAGQVSGAALLKGLLTLRMHRICRPCWRASTRRTPT